MNKLIIPLLVLLHLVLLLQAKLTLIIQSPSLIRNNILNIGTKNHGRVPYQIIRIENSKQRP